MRRTLTAEMQIAREEFERLPLRVHAFLTGVPLHDVWVVDLPRTRGGITLAEFLRRTGDLVRRPPPKVRALLSLRFFVGGVFGWDRTMPDSTSESFAQRLTDETVHVRSRRRECPTDFFASSTASTTSSSMSSLIARFTPEHSARSPRLLGLSLLFRRLYARGQPLHPALHGSNRSVP
jgi:hypothetical protein